jgi:hypothetical protein
MWRYICIYDTNQLVLSITLGLWEPSLTPVALALEISTFAAPSLKLIKVHFVFWEMVKGPLGPAWVQLLEA